MAQDRKTVVLVADDEPSTLAMVASHLRARGYKVLEASDGDQAWELAHEHLPHLVVLDVMMPGMSGWEVCRKIREAVSLAHTGVVMLTGIGENLNEMTSPLYGADAYIDKPFEFSQLDKRIQETLGRRRAGAVGRLDGSEVDLTTEETATVDDGWTDPSTMPGVGGDEPAKPAKAKKPKSPGPAKAKAKPAAVSNAPAKAEKPAKKSAPKKPKVKAKAKTAKKPAKAAAKPKKPAKAAVKAKKPAKAAAKPKKPVKAAAKPKKPAKAAAKPKKPAKAAAKAKKPVKGAKPVGAKLSGPLAKSAARTAKKQRGKKK